MHQSAFDYTLTRKYPYRWFTWVVALGGIAATAIFSVVNVAANGYDLSPVYVINPNATENPQTLAWYQKMPWSLISKVSTICQDQIIPVGSSFQTNNSRLHYTISEINLVADSQQQPNMSLAYHNNYFRDCLLDTMIITSQWDNITINSTIICTMYSRQGAVNLTLTNTASALDPGEGQNRPLDNQTDSALWWAEYLLQNLRQDVFNVRNQSHVDQLYFRRGDDNGMTLFINRNWRLGEFPYQTFQFRFGLSEFFDKWSTTFGSDVISSYKNFTNNQAIKWDPKNPDADVLHILDMDALAKVTYSYLMTDLGQDIDSNMFASPYGIVEYFNTSNRFMLGETWPQDFHLCSYLVRSRLCNYTFDDPSYQDISKYYEYVNAGVPEVGSAFISAQYACQVPTLKPFRSLVVSVIIGDLVLLQALWSTFNWIVKMFLTRHHSQANSCVGCLHLQAALVKAFPNLIPEFSAKGKRESASLKTEATSSRLTHGPKGSWPSRASLSCLKPLKIALDWVMSFQINVPRLRRNKRRRNVKRFQPNNKRRARLSTLLPTAHRD